MTTFSVSNVTGTNQSGELGFVVSLDAPSASTVTVDYSTAGGTATSGVDFKPKSGKLIFYPGQTSKTVPVEVYPDDIHSTPIWSSFELNLYNPTGVDLEKQKAIGVIQQVGAGTFIYMNAGYAPAGYVE